MGVSEDTTLLPRLNHTGVIRCNMKDIIKSLNSKGYNPMAQICGYLRSGDPSYITSYNDARAKVVRMDLYDMFEDILSVYIDEISKEDANIEEIDNNSEDISD